MGLVGIDGINVRCYAAADGQNCRLWIRCHATLSLRVCGTMLCGEEVVALRRTAEKLRRNIGGR